MQRPEAARYRYRSSSRRRRRRLPGKGGLDLVFEADVVTKDVQQEGSKPEISALPTEPT